MSEGDRTIAPNISGWISRDLTPRSYRRVASEDQQFPFHAGFDLNSIRESVRASENGKKTCAAPARSPSRSRRTCSSGTATVLSARDSRPYFTPHRDCTWPKERILEVYLNIAEFGNGIYGVQAASERFFHKPASRLSSGEAATLAAVLPNPIKMHAERPSATCQNAGSKSWRKCAPWAERHTYKRWKKNPTP